MIDEKYFIKFKFTKGQIQNYIDSCQRDLNIAKDSPVTEVKFMFAYNALIKAGIALIALNKGMKVRSVRGHHVKILETISEILGDENIFNIGNAIRTKRNMDLYSGGTMISEKESVDYCEFIDKIIAKIIKKIK
jgi:hypothetical protein